MTTPADTASLSDLLGRCTFPPPGQAAVAAVSGGADSAAMLVLAVAAGCSVTAVHVDHGLRPGSADEADVVRALAQRVGAAFRSERVQVEPGANLEARAREARRAVLGPDAMTGHTADDQAETVLLHLLRGAGLTGLGAMRAGPTKPILGLRRADTARVCASWGIVALEDPSNLDPSFRRNRVRGEVVPLLDDVAERDTAPLLARSAGLLADDEALLDDLATTIDPTDVRALTLAPPPLGRRAVRRWLTAGRPPYPPDLATTDRVLAVARGEARATDVGGGRRVRRSSGKLFLEP